MNASFSLGRAHPTRLCPSSEPIALRTREVRSLTLDKGQRLCCTRGVVWLTQSGDAADYLLRAGESYTARTRGHVVVQGMNDAQFCVEEK